MPRIVASAWGVAKTSGRGCLAMSHRIVPSWSSNRLPSTRSVFSRSAMFEPSRVRTSVRDSGPVTIRSPSRISRDSESAHAAPAPHDPGGSAHRGDVDVQPRLLPDEDHAAGQEQDGGRGGAPRQPAAARRGRQRQPLEHRRGPTGAARASGSSRGRTGGRPDGRAGSRPASASRRRRARPRSSRRAAPRVRDGSLRRESTSGASLREAGHAVRSGSGGSRKRACMTALASCPVRRRSTGAAWPRRSGGGSSRGGPAAASRGSR